MFENLSLIKNGKIKNSGVLLFCKNITKFFTHATITCVVFQGTERLKILDRKEFDRDLYTNFENALNYLKEKLKTEYIIRTGGPREEKIEVPEEALREALLNAIGHRNYFMTTSIFVEIYSDRIEITNPGCLVKGLERKDLGKKSMPRNNLLFGLMQRINLVEKVGTGIRRMQNAMSAYKLDFPKIEADSNWFTIIFRRPEKSYEERVYGKKDASERLVEKVPEKVPEKLTLNQERIINEIRKSSRITIQELSNIVGISGRKIKTNISKLKKKRLLKRIGPDRGGYWKVKK